jgi:chromosome partitioning protein
MEAGERVFILETDLQGTVSYWSARRSNPEPAIERMTNRFRLERALRDIKRRGCTLVIIDTPGSASDVVTEAIRLADLCLISGEAKPS